MNELEKIIANYDDIAETPPEYSDVMPTRDDKVYEYFPNVKIRIMSGLNSKDSFYPNIRAKKESSNANVNTRNTKNIMNTRNIMTRNSKTNNIQTNKSQSPIKTVVNAILEDDDDVNDLDEEENFHIVKEKYQMGVKDLAHIHESYYKLNIHLKHFLNQYEYIISNHNLNEKNKKIKLVGFVKEFVEQFNPKLKEFWQIKACSFYLDQIKLELLKFIGLRYEMFYRYIVEAKDLKESLGELQYSPR